MSRHREGLLNRQFSPNIENSEGELELFIPRIEHRQSREDSQTRVLGNLQEVQPPTRSKAKRQRCGGLAVPGSEGEGPDDLRRAI